ncbi:natural killer cells antigen CD94-like [Talpa occidentalis]|uniref:natural killer cells antigen CD94-like n=1 Tax=Talpa occidentalis TaxID=50954 RepID=UPI00188DDDC3|nr:natural killer cells antigen CD94-like [Talpa occidentalis]
MAEFRCTLWSWISGILGIMCLSLMATLGIVLTKSFHEPSVEPPMSTMSPGTIVQFQKDSGHSSCQETWVGYQCNCYFISNEFRTWNESRDFCVSENSTLLQLDNRDELNFMKFNANFYWIGVTYSADYHDWVWLNGSVVTQEFPINIKARENKCLTYSGEKRTLDSCDPIRIFWNKHPASLPSSHLELTSLWQLVAPIYGGGFLGF